MSGETTPSEGGDASADGVVGRRSAHGWQVGDEQTADLTSAMVLVVDSASNPLLLLPEELARGGSSGSSPRASIVGGGR